MPAPQRLGQAAPSGTPKPLASLTSSKPLLTQWFLVCLWWFAPFLEVLPDQVRQTKPLLRRRVLPLERAAPCGAVDAWAQALPQVGLRHAALPMLQPAASGKLAASVWLLAVSVRVCYYLIHPLGKCAAVRPRGSLARAAARCTALTMRCKDCFRKDLPPVVPQTTCNRTGSSGSGYRPMCDAGKHEPSSDSLGDTKDLYLLLDPGGHATYFTYNASCSQGAHHTQRSCPA